MIEVHKGGRGKALHVSTAYVRQKPTQVIAQNTNDTSPVQIYIGKMCGKEY